MTKLRFEARVPTRRGQELDQMTQIAATLFEEAWIWLRYRSCGLAGQIWARSRTSR